MSRFLFKILQESEKHDQDLHLANDPGTDSKQLENLYYNHQQQQHLIPAFQEKSKGIIQAIAKNPNTNLKTLADLTLTNPEHIPHVLNNEGLQLEMLAGSNFENDAHLANIASQSLHSPNYADLSPDHKNIITNLKHMVNPKYKNLLDGLDHNSSEDEIDKSVYHYLNPKSNSARLNLKAALLAAMNPNIGIETLKKISKYIPDVLLQHPKLQNK